MNFLRVIFCDSSFILKKLVDKWFLLFFDADIPEFEIRAVTEEADVALLVEQARVLLAVGGAVPGGFADVAVHYHLAV
jgi:hypothetical protein